MRAFGVAAGFVLLAALVYGAYYFSYAQTEKRALNRRIRQRQLEAEERLKLEEKERSAGVYWPNTDKDR